MDCIDIPLAARLRLRVEGGRLLIEKRVQLHLRRWTDKAVPDGLSAEQALTELRGRPVPWQGEPAEAKPRASRPRPAGSKKVPRK